MNRYYVKTLLYTFPHIDRLCGELDEYLERRALNSINDYSPAEQQCLNLVKIIFAKERYIEMKEKISGILCNLKEQEMQLLDYKYFKSKPKESYENFDYKSRAYFRKQHLVISKLEKLFDKNNLSDEFFEKEYMPINFIKLVLRRVIDHERAAQKNKRKLIAKSNKNFFIEKKVNAKTA